MRRSLSVIAVGSLVAGLTLIAAPAAHAAPTLDPATERFADFTFSLSDSTDLVPEQTLTVTLTKTPGGDPLCARLDGDTWVEATNDTPVIVFLALYTVDGGTHTLVDFPLQAQSSVQYVTGMTELAVEIDLDQLSVPGPYAAYAFCQAQTGERQYSGEAAEVDVTFTPFSFSPAQTPAGSATTLSIPSPDQWCRASSSSPGHSVVLYLATSPGELWDGGASFRQWPADWEEESGPALGSFDPFSPTPISVPITLPADLVDGTYWIAIQCVGPESDFYEESGSARYFGTLTIGPLLNGGGDDTGTEPPALAETGAAPSWAFGMLALGLLTGGVLLLSRVRRASQA